MSLLTVIVRECSCTLKKKLMAFSYWTFCPVYFDCLSVRQFCLSIWLYQKTLSFAITFESWFHHTKNNYFKLRCHQGYRCFTKTLFSNVFLPPWTEMSQKYLGTDKFIFRGVVQDSIYDVTAPLLAWRCHRQRRHDVVLWTTKTTLKSDYLLKIKAWEKNNQSLHSGRNKGIPSSCPWFATSTTRQASLWIANHGHEDGIPFSLPECSDRFYYSYELGCCLAHLWLTNSYDILHLCYQFYGKLSGDARSLSSNDQWPTTLSETGS